MGVNGGRTEISRDSGRGDVRFGSFDGLKANTLAMEVSSMLKQRFLEAFTHPCGLARSSMPI